MFESSSNTPQKTTQDLIELADLVSHIIKRHAFVLSIREWDKSESDSPSVLSIREWEESESDSPRELRVIHRVFSQESSGKNAASVALLQVRYFKPDRIHLNGLKNIKNLVREKF